MATSAEYQRQLAVGLVGEHYDLYLNNAYFRRMIDLLVELLPLWVDSIARTAFEQQMSYERRLNTAMNQPHTVITDLKLQDKFLQGFHDDKEQ